LRTRTVARSIRGSASSAVRHASASDSSKTNERCVTICSHRIVVDGLGEIVPGDGQAEIDMQLDVHIDGLRAVALARICAVTPPKTHLPDADGASLHAV
jgi:hypothetical protein